MPSGTIKLWNASGELVTQKPYRNNFEKHKALINWKNTYGKKFLELTVEDQMDVDVRMTEKMVKREKSPWKKGQVKKYGTVNRVRTRFKNPLGGKIW